MTCIPRRCVYELLHKDAGGTSYSHLLCERMSHTGQKIENMQRGIVKQIGPT